MGKASHLDTEQSLPRIPSPTFGICAGTDTMKAVMNEVAAAGKLMRITKGASFQTLGSNRFYYIETGRLRMDFISPTGRQRPLLLFENGSMINIANSILKKKYSGTFFALEDSRLWSLDRGILMEVNGSYPAITQACFYVLSCINMLFQTDLTYLDMDDFRICFCRYLVFTMRSKGSPCFSIGITQEKCAHHLGVHRSTLARTVQFLKKEGVLAEFTKNRVVILNREKLLQLAHM